MNTVVVRASSLLMMLLLSLTASPQSEPIPLDIEPHAADTGPAPHIFTHRAMYTEFTLRIYLRPGDVGRDDLTPIAEEAFQAVDSLEQQISNWLPNSAATALNQNAGKGPVPVRQDLYDLLRFSAQVHRDTQGAFDVTVGPLLDVWRAATKEGREPRQEELAQRLPLVGMDKVEFDDEARTVALKLEGMSVDFGGIGKGMAIDKAAEVLRRYKVTSALISGGDSSLLAIGAPPGKEFWRIGINNPYNTSDRLDSVLIRDESLSTSACYHARTGSTEDRPCGIFDPRTGRGVTGMLSTTVVAPTGIQTDALSTAFFVMGIEAARQYCEQHRAVRAVMAEQPADDEPKPVKIGRANDGT